ncbi:MAG: TraB/GumN family protein [Treponema sp.]|nr:TraB/GumN family protein [Treponema sp.]MBQ5877372.1 TraB/GumN family protein [Treponema sp.]
MSNTQKVLTLNGRTITLIGTAHISQDSINEVTEAIKTQKPDCVAIELDQKRCDSIKNPDSWRQLDIIKVLKRGEGFLLLANLVLASFQKRMGQNVGVRPGDEMVAAMKVAEELNIPTTMVDRPIQTTLRRAWAKNSLWGKCKLLSAMISSAFTSEKISSEEIEELKNNSEMDSMMKELSDYMPTVKEVLIDERDKYLASHIWESEGSNIIAVLGAGHLPGVQAYLEKIAAGQESTDTTEIANIPSKTLGAKIKGWIIPAIIVILIGMGFYFGGKNKGTELVLSWVLWNGALSAIGSIIAAAHPLTILVSFIGAPITSLCPFVGVGFLTGITQAFICKPKVKDIEDLSTDAGSLKGFYKNRVLKVLLVFILSSLGSSIGTFVSGADIISKLSSIITITN